MRITIFGCGYVGLVTGACLADFGHQVTCCDIDGDKIAALSQGKVPIYEPGLPELVERNLYYHRLIFSTDLPSEVAGSELAMIAVGTPPLEDGAADLTAVWQCATTIGRYMTGPLTVVTKSTVPVGTGRQVLARINAELGRRGLKLPLQVVSNPEFLREGSAIYDTLHPDRVVIGLEEDERVTAQAGGVMEQACGVMRELYRVLEQNRIPFIYSTLETAELTKYAANAFLATKISFINEIANLCEKTGANVLKVAEAMGLDPRIGPHFLQSGPGYGGSCFPKDTKALVRLGLDQESPLTIVEAALQTNHLQPIKMVDKIQQALNGVAHRTIAVLGLAFKPETDDVREAPALAIIRELIGRGALVRACDPVALKQADLALTGLERVQLCNGVEETVEAAEAVVLVTEWECFRSLDLPKMAKLLARPYFFDLRNVYSREQAEAAGLIYHGVGVGNAEIRSQED